MTFDTLIYNGVEKSFVDWGFIGGSCKGRKQNQADDDFSATIGTATIAGEATTPTFPFEAQVVVMSGRTLSAGVYTGGTVKFQGKRVGQPQKATAAGQGVTYTFKGPWYDLQQTHYQQYFAASATNTPVLIAETVLNSYAQNYFASGVEAYWGNISTGDQIQFVLEWLLQQYNAQGMSAPYQLVGASQHFTGGTAAWSYTDGAAVTPTATPSNAGAFMTWPAQSSPTISATLSTLYLPSFITKPIKCADAIRKCLEFSPRGTVWFDYTQTPPMAHVTMPGEFTAKTLPLFDGTSHKSLSINRRDDLTVRGVYICYRISNKISGAEIISYVVDYWNAAGGWNSLFDAPPVPSPHSGLRVISELIDLQGSNTSFVTGWMDCEPLACRGSYLSQLQKRSWWASGRGGEHSRLADWRVRFQDKTVPTPNPTTIPDAQFFYSSSGVDSTGASVVAGQEFTAADYAFYTNRIVRGAYASWMSPVQSVKAVIKVSATWASYDITGSGDLDTSGNRLTMNNNEELHVNVELTNASNPVTGGVFTDSTESSAQPGESYVIGNGGIAQYLFNHMNAVQYDGEAVHVASEFADNTASNYVDLGCVLNLQMPAGSPQPWTGMNAQIQKIEEDYHNHYTTVCIGVAKHLNSGQLSAFLNMWRNRRAWYNPAIRGAANSGNGSQVSLPSANSQSDALAGLVNNGASQHMDYTTTPSGGPPVNMVGVVGGIINHDPQLITKTLAAASVTSPTNDQKTMQPREMQVCDPVSGAVSYIIVHSTASYTKP